MSTVTSDQPGARTQVRTGSIDATPLARQDAVHLRIGVAQVLFVLAAVIAWLFVYLYVLSGFTQGHAQQQLYGRLREELAAGTAPQGAPVAAGAPVALLDAPRLGLHHVVVVEGTRPAQLQDGPGHALGSVLPGQSGTSVLMGRSLSYGGPFRRLPELRRGDVLTTTTAEGTFHYAVADVRRAGDPVPGALPNGGARLVLVTATGSAPLAHSNTVYVDATLTGRAQPPGAVTAADPAGAPMARDTSAGTLAILALALELLLIVLVALTWARWRWSRLGAWTVGLPILLTVLWMASLVASRVLPNLV